MMQPMMQPTVIVVGGNGGNQLQPYPGIWPDIPCSIECHNCKQKGMTDVTRNLTCCGWICCIIWLFLFFPCMFVVCCCCDGMNKFTHKCQACGTDCGARVAGNTVNYN